MSHSENLETAIQAARTAARRIRELAPQHREMTVRYKGRNDIVTQADVEAEKLIIETIQTRFPEDHFLAEETAGDQTLSDARTWIIDPIDGTTNFAHGFPVFCVSIALYENRQPVSAIILEVSSGEEFTAEKDQGAYLNGTRIHVSPDNNPASSLLSTGFPYKNMELLEDYLKLFKALLQKVQGMRRPGSAAYDLCCVASGRCEGFYEYGLSAWDVAAGALIVREAGGFVSDWHGGENWLFGRRLIAGNKGVHPFLVKQIGDHVSKKHLSNG